MNMLNKKAFSLIEYAVLIVVIVGGLVVMRTYIQRGLLGTWGQSGQSFGFGRQYDSEKSIECSFDEQSNTWYDHNCFESQMGNQKCSIGDTCEAAIIAGCHTVTCGQVSS